MASDIDGVHMHDLSVKPKRTVQVVLVDCMKYEDPDLWIADSISKSKKTEEQLEATVSPRSNDDIEATPVLEVRKPHDVELVWNTSKQQAGVPFGISACVFNGCQTNFFSEKELLIHIDEVHKTSRTVACEIGDCEEEFECSVMFLRHFVLKHMKSTSCLFCERTFKNSKSAAQHMDKFHRNGCLQCGIETANLRELYLHVCDNHKDNATEYVCFCGTTTSSCEKLLNHWREHFGMPKHQCMFCHLSFITSGGLTNHMRTHSQILCQYCLRYLKTSVSAHGFVSHVVNDCRIYKCHYSGCTYSSLYKCHLNTHLIGCHEQWKGLKCTECDHWSPSKQAYMAHRYSVHNIEDGVSDNVKEYIDGQRSKKGSDKQLTCSEKKELIKTGELILRRRPHKLQTICCFEGCYHVASSQEMLQNHVAETHMSPDDIVDEQGRQIFICDICGQKYRNKASLRNHKGYTEKILRRVDCEACCQCQWDECQTCKERFYHTNEFISHWKTCKPNKVQEKALIMTKKKFLACPLCEFYASVKSKLDNHLAHHMKKGHTIPSEYKVRLVYCPHCNYFDSQRHKVLRHMVIHKKKI